MLKIADSQYHSKYAFLLKSCFVLIYGAQPLYKTGLKKQILFLFCKCIISSLFYSIFANSVLGITSDFTHNSEMDCGFPIPVCLATAIQQRERNEVWYLRNVNLGFKKMS